MENASKALLMVGGVLIAILTISLAVLALNRMSAYQKSQSDLVKTEQLSEFNKQFIQYVRDDLTGIDLVTLVNKVENFNKKRTGAGEINYDQGITLYIDMNNYKNKYPGSLFNDKKYTIGGKNKDTIKSNNFSNTIKQYTDLEQKYTLKTISALASNIESLKFYYIDNDKEKGRSISDITGKSADKEPLKTLEEQLKNKNLKGDFKDIELYSEYSQFKTAEFKGLQPKYENGQISELSFQYIGN